MTNFCVKGDIGWHFMATKRRRIYCTRCASGYTSSDSAITIDYKVNLFDQNKDTEWSLRTDVRPINFGTDTRLYANAIGKNEVYVLQAVSEDRLTVDDRLIQETILNYDFVFCGDAFCCCCPEENALPGIIESKLR